MHYCKVVELLGEVGHWGYVPKRYTLFLCTSCHSLFTGRHKVSGLYHVLLPPWHSALPQTPTMCLITMYGASEAVNQSKYFLLLHCFSQVFVTVMKVWLTQPFDCQSDQFTSFQSYFSLLRSCYIHCYSQLLPLSRQCRHIFEGSSFDQSSEFSIWNRTGFCTGFPMTTSRQDKNDSLIILAILDRIIIFHL
jgi:hypothetical protein